MRVAFVTTNWERVKDEDVDRPLHDAAFAELDVTLEHVPWRTPGVDWSTYDLVVLRSPWDYSESIGEFREWLDRVGGIARVENAPSVVKWNLNKYYLRELAQMGVSVVPTEYATSAEDVDPAIERVSAADVVVKPVVSAGSRNTGWFTAGDPGARVLAKQILNERLDVMVQPFISSVSEVGEVSIVLFDGQVSHAFRKGPILAQGGGLIGGTYQEEISAVEPSSMQIEVALAADCAIGTIARDRLGVTNSLLYSRYDVITMPGGEEVLLEAELFEPSFFLSSAPGSAMRFAKAVLARQGLGH